MQDLNWIDLRVLLAVSNVAKIGRAAKVLRLETAAPGSCRQRSEAQLRSSTINPECYSILEGIRMGALPCNIADESPSLAVVRTG